MFMNCHRVYIRCILSEVDLLQAVMDMFLAGKDNLLLSTKWILMALVKYPEVQSKCRSEIHQVCQEELSSYTLIRTRKEFTIFTISLIHLYTNDLFQFNVRVNLNNWKLL